MNQLEERVAVLDLRPSLKPTVSLFLALSSVANRFPCVLRRSSIKRPFSLLRQSGKILRPMIAHMILWIVGKGCVLYWPSRPANV
jgi:hypothetical protein